MTPIDIDCVDGTGDDPVVREMRQMHPGAHRAHSVGHMVDLIIHILGHGQEIRRLRVFGHGRPGYQGLGQSSGGPAATAGYRAISFANGGLAYRGKLAQLTGRFYHWTERLDPMRPDTEHAQAGWVELHGCSVGAGTEGMAFVDSLSKLWGVNVAAGTGFQVNNPGFEGYYIVGHPTGPVETKFGNPVQALVLP